MSAKGRPGIAHTAEARAKMSAARVGRTLSPQHRAKISAGITGRTLSPETRAKIGAAQKGRIHTPEHRAKISAAQKGKTRSLEELRAYILGRISVDESTGCWNWQNSCDTAGYGAAYVSGRRFKAHRLAYEAFVGPIPDGLYVCHHCDNRPCCNPEHLYAGTPSDNTKDMYARSRQCPTAWMAGQDACAESHRRKTHCPQGHPYAGLNLYFERDGSRKCRTCHAERELARRRSGRIASDQLRLCS